MRTTVSIADDLIADLMTLTGARHCTQGINLAIEACVRRAMVERLLVLAGRDVLSNDEIEAMDDAEFRDLHQVTPSGAAPR